MKTKRLLTALPAFALAAVVAFSSCSKEESIDTPAPEGFGYFSVALGTQSVNLTRADVSTTGTDEENFVEGVLIVLYGTGDKVVERFNYTGLTNITGGTTLSDFSGTGIATNVSQPSTGADKNVITKGELIQDGTYKMIVILNPTAAIQAATAANSDLSDFTDAQTGVEAEDFIGASSDRLVMTNANDIITITSSDLYDTAAAAEAAPKRVYVDRVVAKLTTVKGTGFDTNITANTGTLYTAISNISWYVDNLNTETFWVRKPALTKTGIAESAESDRANYYATDPNMTAAGTFTETVDVTDNTELAASYNDLEGDIADAETVYAIENTFDAGVDPVAYGTQVVVKCQIQPLTYAANDSYYSFGGLYFNRTEALAWIGGADLPSNAPSGFDVALLNASGFFGGASDPTNYSEAANGVTFHYQGWNIYRIPIKHFSDLASTAFGYYGVVRNNVYRVNITNITGPGGPGAYDKYIASYITINPWIIRGQDESLGN